MTLPPIRYLFAVAILAIGSAPQARAADIVFDLNQLAFDQPSSSLTVDGYTLLFTGSDGVVAGFSNGVFGGFQSDMNRNMLIQLTTGPTGLHFKEYTIGDFGNLTGGVKSFDLTGGTGVSAGNSIGDLATFSFSGDYSIASSQTVTFSLNNFGEGFQKDTVFFNKLTFTPVPEPSTYALGAIAAAVVGVAARRRRGAV